MPAGFDAGVKLPAVIGDDTSFTLNVGKKPKSGTVTFLAGIAEGEGLEGATFSAVINGEPCATIEDFATLFPGSKRSIQFSCPSTSVKSGANTVQLIQDNGPAQKVVWAELRIDPN